MAKSNNISKGLNSYLQGMSEQDAIKTLEMEGRRLKYIAVKVWRQYLASYKPKSYVRTRDSQRGIRLGRVKKISDTELGIELTFENDLMYHDSIFGKNQPKGHSIMLISEGWHSKKLEAKLGKRIDRFTYFEGTGYLYRVYKEYMKFAPKGISLETQWSGEYLKR